MSTKIDFISAKGDEFTLTYKARCADGNGFTNPCTIIYLFNKRKALIRSFRDDYDYFTEVCIDPVWDTFAVHQRSVCKFLNETKKDIIKKIESREYKIKKVKNKCNY